MQQDTLTAGFESLGDDINKSKGRTLDDSVQGATSEYLSELTLDMKNEEIIKLTKAWKASWDESEIHATWIKQVDENLKYWKGDHYTKIEAEQSRQMQDNQMFQSVETFLPAATRQNPEAFVELRSIEPKTDENTKYAEIIRDRLSDWADDTKIRLKVKKAARHWLISLLGVGKMTWDMTNNRPNVKIIDPKKMILDPNGVADEDGYSGSFAGEYRKLQASELISILEKEPDNTEAIAKINEECKGETSTDIQFIEWWTAEYMCWTLSDVVLRKKKNPHWNYIQKDTPNTPEQEMTVESNPPQESTPNEQIAPLAPNTVEPQTTPAIPTATENTNIPQLTEKDRNHFPTKRIPYIFLSIFNLGNTPVDVTSLMTQNLPQQDLINKRLRQIDKSVDGMNGGVVVSEEKSGLTKEEAKGVTDALRRGGVVVIPSGSAQEAVYRIPSVPLPSDVYNNLLDARNRMYDLFGVRGITPAGIKNEDTVRGKIITKGLDTDRIGGGITEYLEQWCDDVYNYVVQMMYVYDDIFAKYQGAKLPRIKVSVKEGSLIPKDATTKANQAIELCNSGKMSVIDMYEALEYPNPTEMAANLWLEANAPEILFKDDPRVQQVMQQKQQQAQSQAQSSAKPPSESINFKDLPPEGKAQMAKQAGIDITPDSALRHDVSTTVMKKAVDVHGDNLKLSKL